jgi:hypothetical protein
MTPGKLFFLSLVVLVSFASCENFFNPMYRDGGKSNAPSGMGYFSISIDGLQARTIMPQGGLSAFTSYQLTVKEGDTAVHLVTGTLSQVSAPFLLKTGTYDIEVLAYSGSGALAAQKTDTITVIAGTNTHNITLEPISGGTGTFSWNITLPSGATGAQLIIQEMNRMPVQTVSLTTSPATGSVNLPSGFYRVIFSVQKDGKTIERLEILHIYQNLTSLAERDFSVIYFGDGQAPVEVSGSHNEGYNTLADALSVIIETAGTYTVTVYEDQTLQPVEIVTSGVKIALVGVGTGRKVELREDSTGGAYSEGMFLIGSFYDDVSEVELSISNITLIGRNDSIDPVIYVFAGGTFTMFDGSEITGHRAYIGNGGSVVHVENGTFIMEGGNIRNNTIDADESCVVYVNYGTFEMSGGSIINNNADTGIEWTSGVCIDNGTFTMSGGEITGNEGEYGDVFIVEGGLEISGSADIGKLNLSSYSEAVNIQTGWSGEIDILNLSSVDTNMDNVINSWINKTVFTGDINADVISRIGLVNFMSGSLSDYLRPISPTHELNATGVLVTK